MDDRFIAIAGWVLCAVAIVLGGSIVAGRLYHSARPSPMAYPIAGVTVEGISAVTGELSFAEAMARADVAKGRALYVKCVACHSIEKGGPNRLGPNLYGVVGDVIAGDDRGYMFTPALKSKGGKWDFAALDAWLKSPREFAPGTKMTFAGMSQVEDRANLIAYMNSQGSDLPSESEK